MWCITIVLFWEIFCYPIPEAHSPGGPGRMFGLYPVYPWSAFLFYGGLEKVFLLCDSGIQPENWALQCHARALKSLSSLNGKYFHCKVWQWPGHDLFCIQISNTSYELGDNNVRVCVLKSKNCQAGLSLRRWNNGGKCYHPESDTIHLFSLLPIVCIRKYHKWKPFPCTPEELLLLAPGEMVWLLLFVLGTVLKNLMRHERGEG